MIDSILTKNALNISIGSSGSNKTIWELQSLEAAAAGKPAFGLFKTRPLEPVWYVSFDRTTEELENKFKTIKIPKELFRTKSYQSDLHKYETHCKALLGQIFEEAPKGTKLVIIDGIGYVVKDAISQWGVSKVISLLQEYRRKMGLTLKVIHHTPKQKGNDKYDDPREKGLGSGTWCQMSDTSVIFEKVNAGDVNNSYRRVWVLHSDYRGDKEYAFQQQNGRLIHLPGGLPSEVQELTMSIDEYAAHRKISFHRARIELQKKKAESRSIN